MIILAATCATCGKPLKSVQMTVPVRIMDFPTPTPTMSNCQTCGARGAHIAPPAPPAPDEEFDEVRP